MSKKKDRNKVGTKRLYDIVKYPDPILSRGSYEKVERFDPWLIDTVTDMVHTTRTVRGAGLAAPQIGLPLQLAVCIIDKQPVVLLNPEIVTHSDEQVSIEEGCLSCPNEGVRIPRYEWIRVDYDDLKGRRQWLEFNGIDATIVQHELDHLEGKLITDYKNVDTPA